MLTLLAMYAEEEARSASENQKWRIRKKFENGEPWVGDMLGYRLKDGKMTVVPEEAKIVKMIFNDYLSRKLNEMGVPAKYSEYWRSNTILKIIHNEKYMGDMFLQKTYRPDFRAKKGKDNHGEVIQYYVENSHEAIIDKEIFDSVQNEAKRRKSLYPPKQVGKAFRDTGLFVGIMKCGLCGSAYRRRTANSACRPKTVWICDKYLTLGKQCCPSQQIPEDILISKTKEVLGVESLDRDTILERISYIEVTGDFHLRYTLKSGSVQYAMWKHKSRKESWIPEMKEKARQKASERNVERRKDE